MALGCLPLFRRAARKAREVEEDRFDTSDEIEAPSRSLPSLSPGFITTISRKDSGFTSISSSTVASTRSVSVTFNPTVDEVVFDKNEAPCSVRKSSSDGSRGRMMRSNTSPAMSQATLGNTNKRNHHLVISSPPSKLVHQSPSSLSMNYHSAPSSITILPTRSQSDLLHVSHRQRTERRHMVSFVH